MLPVLQQLAAACLFLVSCLSLWTHMQLLHRICTVNMVLVFVPFIVTVFHLTASVSNMAETLQIVTTLYSPSFILPSHSLYQTTSAPVGLAVYQFHLVINFCYVEPLCHTPASQSVHSLHSHMAVPSMAPAYSQCYTCSHLFAVNHLCGCHHPINTGIHYRHNATFNVCWWLDELLHLADSLLIHILQLLYTNNQQVHL